MTVRSSPRAAAATTASPRFSLTPVLLLFLTALSELVLTSPRIRLLESSVCRAHFANQEEPEETECKIPAVQQRLSYIRGWQVFFEALPVLALAYVWGVLADRHGRKPVLLLNYAGCAVNMGIFLVVTSGGWRWAVEWVWASGALGFALGGGPRVASVLILALVADGSAERERSRRLFLTYGAFLGTELVAMPVAGALMRWCGVRTPFALAFASLAGAAGLLAVMKVPRTGGERKEEEEEAADGEEAEGLMIADDEGSGGPGNGLGLGKAWRSLSKTAANRNLLLVLLGHFICPVRQELVFQILIPYASTVFSIPIASAGLLLSVIASTGLVVFVTVLPSLPKLLGGRYGWTPFEVNAVIARLSSALLAAGCVFIAAAPELWILVPGVVVFAAGFGIRIALMSLLTTLVGKGKVGRAFTAVAVVEGVGEVVSALILQGVWRWGLEGGGGWRGCVWVVGGVVYVVGAWAGKFIKEERNPQPEE